ncbi:uncharacterized protein [Malus domestica]|uniref:uncharacterized protein n=1 Tax=Malus domestica TaxID=3750 RepID=UPI003975092D
MKFPTTLNETQSLTKRVAALNRFLSRSTDRCKPFFKAIKRAQRNKWDEECEKTFQDLKKYLPSPPLLSKPEAAEDLFIYLAVSKVEVSSDLIQEEMGAQLPRPNDALEAAERILATLIPSDKDFWHLHIDGASNYKGSGAGVVLVTPNGSMLEQAITLGFKTSNNEAEYEALLAGLRIAKDLAVKNPAIHYDSQLITSQTTGEYMAKHLRMTQYLEKWAIDLVGLMYPAIGSRCRMIVATDYFTKWVEAESIMTMTQTDIEHFIWRNIIYRFSILQSIVTDNGS